MAENDWMPGAIKLPVSWADSAQEMSRHGHKPNKFIMHVADSEAYGPSMESYFERVRSACSQFYVEYDGDIYQFQPISARSGADYGSDVTVSAETQGRGSGKWTQAQVNSLAAIAAWLIEKHGIKPRMLETSSESESGIGTHRLGCDGNFPSSGVQRGRKQRSPLGEKLSGVLGKICPGYDRQAQWPTVVKLALKLVDGVKLPSGGNNGKPTGPTLLRVDGVWGNAVILSEQKRLGMKVKDGEYSHQNTYWKPKNKGLGSGWEWETATAAKKGGGSKTIVEDQKRLKKAGHYRGDVDGLAGPEYFKAKQRELKKEGWYKGRVDGRIDRPSSTVKAMQHKENARRKAAFKAKQK